MSLPLKSQIWKLSKCLKLAYKAGKEGGLAPCILNGANEEAVALLLKKNKIY